MLLPLCSSTFVAGNTHQNILKVYNDCGFRSGQNVSTVQSARVNSCLESLLIEKNYVYSIGLAELRLLATILVISYGKLRIYMVKLHR